jgi:hypothetical protein
MARAKCKNVNCDAAMRGEIIEIPQDGRCPECGKPMQPEGTSTNSATEMARKKRMQTLMIGGGVGTLFIAGVLAWVFMGEKSPPTDAPVEEQVSMAEMVETQPTVTPPPEPVAPAPLAAAAPVIEPEPVTPTPVDTPLVEPVSNEPSLETQQHVKQAMIFVSLAKGNPTTRSENIKNALAEFDVAVKQEEAQGRCFAKAYMNRGIAYWLDKKLNLAEKDLVKASECDDKDAVIFYNLTSYYSAINKADLALEPLNKALDLGFKDCDILRKDPDLKNLRKMSDFKRALEQHSLFCLK